MALRCGKSLPRSATKGPTNNRAKNIIHLRETFVLSRGVQKLQHFLQHDSRASAKRSNIEGIFELPVPSIMGAQDMRQNTIFCDFLSIADVYRGVHNRARASFHAVSRPFPPVFNPVSTIVATGSRRCSSAPRHCIQTIDLTLCVSQHAVWTCDADYGVTFVKLRSGGFCSILRCP